MPIKHTEEDLALILPDILHTGDVLVDLSPISPAVVWHGDITIDDDLGPCRAIATENVKRLRTHMKEAI